jgi:drug/metabolite transporter (DMT)-like permease
MIALDIAAPIALLFGLSMTTPANASLLNNFEIVATSLIALLVFKEAVGRRMWLALALITLSSLILSFEDMSSLSFSLGSLLVLAACVCWGFENNCTRMLSHKNPLHIVVVKGLGSGIGALVIAFASGEYSFDALYIVLAILLGFFAYGLSIYFYIRAQRDLGAARTSAYYAVAPFIGVGLSLIIFGNPLTATFILALIIMIAGAYLVPRT